MMEDDFTQNRSRSMSDRGGSDIDSKNEKPGLPSNQPTNALIVYKIYARKKRRKKF